MKKFFIALISAIFSCITLFSFVGCSDNGSEGQNEVQPQGTLLWLESAYSDGLISYDDLRSIAYYYNGESAEADFVPSPKNPEQLSAETIRKIKETYYYQADGFNKGASVDDVYVSGYCGTYNGYVVVEIGSGCDTGIGGEPMIYEEYEIDGVIFYWYTPLRVWKSFDE